ncbi:hypothetical protein [Burkholderia multivorans]|uniref:hypothetical protein n=1 Tax=Burkholderia multivorans TaxID=87883 RepID=UPI00190722C0|nr:hypothetical protein [Burkholderia multivorans]MBJ9624095.1 hypothetical protein [Burkholderia multivorans]
MKKTLLLIAGVAALLRRLHRRAGRRLLRRRVLSSSSALGLMPMPRTRALRQRDDAPLAAHWRAALKVK